MTRRFKKIFISSILASSILVSIPSVALAANGDLWKGDTNIGSISSIILSNKKELFNIIKNPYRFGYELEKNIYNVYDVNTQFNKYPNASLDTIHKNIKKTLTAEREVPNSETKDFDTRFNEARTQYYLAKSTKNSKDAWLAMEKAKALESCEASDMLEYECRILLGNIGEISLNNDEKQLIGVYYEFCNMLNTTGLDVSDTNSSTIVQAIKLKFGNDIGATVTKVSSNANTGEEIVKVVLTKGSASTYPISINFK